MHSPLTNKIMLADPSNYSVGRGGYKVCKITPHHMAAIWTAERCAQSFQDPNRNASANYCIGSDGTIVCNVDEVNRAWTSSDGTNDYQAITIEVANNAGAPTWSISDAAWKALVNLCADICKRYGFRLNFTGNANGSLTMHKMFAATSCPGPYLEARMPQLAQEVNAILDGQSSGATSTPSTGSGQSIADVARDVIAGKYGNGSARKAALEAAGYNYDAVQAEVNRQLGVGGATSAPSKTVDQLAQEVIAGAWGNGADRQNRLTAAGYDYNAVQTRVNQILTGSSGGGKTIDQLAREVIAGQWGNGTDRKNRLQAAGYDYNAVQARVNQLLS